MKRCNCGAHGTWAARHAVIGYDGEHKVVWRGCRYHTSAVGRPVPFAVWRRGEAAIEQYEAQRAEREEAARAQEVV